MSLENAQHLVESVASSFCIPQREAIVLVDVEGYSVEEAAEMLDCPAGTVKSRCSRGRARLAEALGFLRDDRDSSENTPGDERNHHPPPSVGRSGTVNKARTIDPKADEPKGGDHTDE